MTRYDQRLQKLEQRIDPQDARLGIVWVNEGESKEEAAARTGADQANTMFVGWRGSTIREPTFQGPA